MSDTVQLVLAALSGIAVIVLLITLLKVHPVISLFLGSLTVGVVSWSNLEDVLVSFGEGFGTTMAGVGLLVALGAMFGKLLFDSGGADEIVETLVSKSSRRYLPWTMAGVGALIGLPMFFEIGLVLLVPVIFLVARRAQLPLMSVAIPTLAGLSVMHGFVPPHPGPLVAIDNVGADLGLTLGLGVALAIPTVLVAGPLFAPLAARWVPVRAPALYAGDAGAQEERPAEPDPAAGSRTGQPSFPATVATVLLPVTLMLGKALADVLAPDSESVLKTALDFAGTPVIALLSTLLVGMFTLGRPAGMGRKELSTTVEQALPPVAGVILIVGAGGGFKQVLIDSGIGEVITQFARDSGMSVLLLGWLVAVLVRLATGSATVATVTASGIMAPLVTSLGLTSVETSLLVLAIGSGSLIFSHVNDAGFWLIKELFQIDVAQTIKTWSVMETIIAVVGLVLVLVTNLLL